MSGIVAPPLISHFQSRLLRSQLWLLSGSELPLCVTSCVLCVTCFGSRGYRRPTAHLRSSKIARAHVTGSSVVNKKRLQWVVCRDTKQYNMYQMTATSEYCVVSSNVPLPPKPAPAPDAPEGVTVADRLSTDRNGFPGEGTVRAPTAVSPFMLLLFMVDEGAGAVSSAESRHDSQGRSGELD